ncbi:MAG: hypothetical protein RLZZ262_1593 [Bacteroidota bacterium]
MKQFQIHIILLFTLLSVRLFGQDFTLYPLPVYAETGIYGISVKDQGLLVTSQRPSSRFVEFKDQSGNNSTTIYSISDTASKKMIPLADIPQRQLNESCGQYIQEKEMYVFSRSIAATNHNRKSTALGIFILERKNGKFVESAFPHNDEMLEFQTGHPYFDNKTNRLYYSCNAPGGSGGTDIYYSTWSNANWSSPILLDNAINTEKNEIFPTINLQGDLIFASQNTENGDYDLYRAKWNGTSFESAQKLGEPFNSPSDDLQLIYTSSNEQGYLVSNRENGVDRVFAFYVPRPEFKDCAESVKPHFCYLFEETTIVPSDTVPMLYEWAFSDGNTYKGLKVKHCFANLGEYTATLNVYDSTTQVLYANLSELQLSIQKSQLPFIDSRERFAYDSLQRFVAQSTEIDSFKVEEVHWQFGDGGYERGEVVFHQYTEPGEYQLDLLFIGTNSNGEMESRCATKTIYAIESNEDPSKSIVSDELKEPDALTINNTTFISTARDSVEYFVEFKQSETKMEMDDPFFANIHFEITERTSNRDSLFHYTVGAENDFAATMPILQDLRSNGYNASIIKDQEQVVSERSRVRNWWYIPDSIESALNKQMNKFNDIKFETGSFAINKQSFDELNYIVKVLQSQPSTSLEIIAHTDSVGTEDNNLILSKKRAESVAEYLTSKGISRTRLQTRGMGELQSALHRDSNRILADDRRVEFKIIRKS